MTKNAGRKGRWTQRDARTYTSALGPVVYRQDAWYARLAYQVREPPSDEGALPAWVILPRHFETSSPPYKGQSGGFLGSAYDPLIFN